ncbi:MAG: 50S ribosomal protein L24 [Dehalococcoidia bacterium]
MAQRIRRDDDVIVIRGKDRGRRGKVIRVLRRKEKVVVEGVNMITRHVKARPGLAQAGRVQQEAPIAVSNVMFVDPETGAQGRIAWRTLEDGTKVRVVKSGRES